MRNFWTTLLGQSLSRGPNRKKTTTRLNVETIEERIVPTLIWSSGVALPYASTNDVAIKESNQSLLVLGGTTYQFAVDGTAWNAVSPSFSTYSAGVASLGASGILVYGGGSSAATIYDPNNASNTHSVASMSTLHNQMAFATDGSNRAYAIGGLDANGTRLTTVERYDPATADWTTVAPLPVALSGAVAAYDGAGDIFVFGGATDTATTSTTALKYVVATDTWSTVAAMSSSITEAAAVDGPDGLIYVLGGIGSDGAQRSSVRIYHPTTNSWTSGTSLPIALSDEAAVVDAQNRIEVIGGTALSDDPYSSSAVYVTQTLADYAPVITTTALPSATEGVAYSATVAAIAQPAPTFSLVPSADTTGTGMSIDPNTGVITWSPTAAQLGSHTVTVQVTNSAGTATQTFTLPVTTDITPPTAPVLTMEPITTTNTIVLDWSGAIDNVGVAGYRLYLYAPAYTTGHSGKGGGYTYHPAVYTLFVNNIPATTTSYTVTGLAPATTYYFAVAAFDAVGNQSAYSNVVSGATLQTPSITYYVSSAVNPPLSVVVNHQLYFTLSTSGSPAPTLSLVSAPTGVLFSFAAPYSIPTVIWTPTADQVGVGHIVMQATNSVGTVTLDIPVTVTADVPVPALVVNGGYAYGLGNMTAVAGTPNDYQLSLYQPTFGTTAAAVQYAMVGTPFSFQFTGTSNTNPITYAIVNGPAGMSINPSTGLATWLPGASDANAATSVTASATNTAGTTLLTFTFPTYFTTAPTSVAVGFYTNTSGAAPATYTPIVTWTAPANSSAITDYMVTVTSALTNVTTTYDTQSTATSFALPLGITGQNWVNVTAYDANGNPSQTSTGNAPLYVAALTSLSWSPTAPTAVVGQALSVQFTAAYSTFAIVSGPTAARIDPASGLLTWTPTSADVGTAEITVSANEGWGPVYTTLSIPVTSLVAATATTLTSSGPNPSAAGQAVSFTATVTGGSAIDGETVTIEDASNANAVVASPTLTGGSVTFTISDLSAGTHLLFAVYNGDATHAASNDSTTPVTQVVTGLAPAVASVLINGGSPAYLDSNNTAVSLAGQNSVVEQILVTFNEAVTLDPGAITVANNSAGITVLSGPAPNTLPVTASFAVVPSSGDTQFIVTFSGPGTNAVAGGSGNTIKDGLYILNIDGTKVHANGLTAADNNTGFWALYGSVAADNILSTTIGDGNSEVVVDTPDAAQFKHAFGSESDIPDGPPAYNVGLDSNLSGVIDTPDAARFKHNFGADWSF